MPGRPLPLGDRRAPARTAPRGLLAGLVLGLAAPALAQPSAPLADRAACLARFPPGTFVARELLPGRSFLVFKQALPAHRDEWRASGIAPELIDHALVSIPDVACDSRRPTLAYPIQDYLGPIEPRWLPRLERTGWLGRQVDLAGRARPSQVKPDAAHRRGRNKYEDPAGPLAVGLLEVPPRIAARVARRAGVRLPAGGGGFWPAIHARRVRLVLTEGAKKAAALLSLGYAGVSLPGVCAGLVLQDESGRHHEPRLHPELAALLAPGLEVVFAFDHDADERARKFVRTTLHHTASAVERAGAHVLVLELPGPDKGVDDFIVARGTAALEELFRRARPFAAWRADNTDLLPLPGIYDIGGCR